MEQRRRVIAIADIRIARRQDMSIEEILEQAARLGPRSGLIGDGRVMNSDEMCNAYVRRGSYAAYRRVETITEDDARRMGL